MKDYKDYEELRDDLFNYLEKNPLKQTVCINGKEVGILTNFTYSIVLSDDETRDGTASSAYGITPMQLLINTKLQSEKILDNALKHIKTI